MNEKKALVLAKEGFELYKQEKYFEAEEIYSQAMKHINPDHLSTTDIHAQYALVLHALNKKEEALEQYKLALNSALKSDEPNSVTVTYARFCLADYYRILGNLKEGLKIIKPSLETECESKWLACFLAAQIHYKLGNEEASNEFASQVMFLAPKGKYKSLKELKNIIRSNYVENS